MPRRKNCKRSDWLWVELKRSERAKQGKKTEFRFHSQIVGNKKINKDVARNVTSNEVINARFGKMPTTPEDWVATTPPSIDIDLEYSAGSDRKNSDLMEPTLNMFERLDVSDLVFEENVVYQFFVANDEVQRIHASNMDNEQGAGVSYLDNDWSCFRSTGGICEGFHMSLNEFMRHLQCDTCPAEVLRAALLLACKYNEGHLVTFLLSRGVSPDSRSDYGIPCLMVASCCNSEGVVHQLIAASADVVLTDRSGRRSWDIIRGSSKHQSIASVLWQKGLEHYNQKILEAAAAGDAKGLQSAIQHGADPSYTSKDAYTRSSHTGVLGWTPLHYAAAYGNFEAARVLVEAGARINATCYLGKTPLYMAHGSIPIPNSHVREQPTSDIIELLTAKGAKKTWIDGTGRRVLDKEDNRKDTHQADQGVLDN